MKSPENVIVGEYYDVPCKLINNDWLPIIFPPHKDGPDFCFDPAATHYHIDKRFTYPREYAAWRVEYGERIEVRKVICIKKDAVSFNDLIHPFAVVKMHEVFEKHTLKSNICPHQGLQITNSCGTCPGHGLVWDFETRKLKYKLPFYLFHKNSGLKGVIKDGKCTINVNITFQFKSDDLTFVLVDSDGRLYPNAGISLDKYQDILITPDDKIVWTDKNCAVVTP